MTLIQLFDKLFNYMPPLPHKQDPAHAANTVAAQPIQDDSPSPLSVHERVAGGMPLSPQIPGVIGEGGLTPEQQFHVIHMMPQGVDTTIMPSLENIAKKAGIAAIGGTGAAIGSGASTGSAIASGAASAVPVAVAAVDAALVGVGLVDMFGGDVAIPTYAPMSPEFDASTAAGQFHGAAEAKVINASLAMNDAPLLDDTVAAPSTSTAPRYKFASKTGVRDTLLE